MAEKCLNRRDFLATSSSALLAGCGQQSEPAEAQGPWTLRYRLRVRVEADGKVHEGSGVFQSEYRRLPLWTPMRTQEFAARGWGEAVEIERVDHKKIFALLDTVSAAGARHRFSPLDVGMVTRTLPAGLSSASAFSSGEVFELAAETRGSLALAQRFWPIFVVVESASDPSSATLVELPGQDYRPWPETRTDTLESVFGPGAQVSDVTLEVVDEPVTRGIEQRHPWIRSLQGNASDSVITDASAPLFPNLSYKNFVMNGYGG